LFTVEYRLRRKDGSLRHMLEQGIPSHDADGGPSHIDGVIFDITEQKQKEETLRMQSRIIEQIHEAVVSTDLDGYITSWNRGAEILSGYTREEVMGKHISLAYPQDQLDFLQNQVIAPLLEKGYHETIILMKKKSGEKTYADISLSLLRDPRQQVTGMIGFSRNITEWMRAEEALKSRLAQQEMLMQLGWWALSGETIAAMIELAGEFAARGLHSEYSSVFLESKVSLFAPQECFSEQMILMGGAEIRKSFAQPEFFENKGIVTSGGVPIFQNNLLYGFLGIHSREQVDFNQDDANFLRGIANILGLSIERRRSQEILESYVMRLQILHHIDQAILEKQSPIETGKIALRHIRQVIPCMRASIALFDENSMEATVLAVDTDISTGLIAGSRIPVSRASDQQELLKVGKPHLVADIMDMVNPLPIYKQLLRSGIRSYIAIPLIASGEFFGSLNLSFAYPNAISREQIEIASQIAASLAVAIRDDQLYDQVVTTRQHLRLLTRKVVEVQESERSRISRELHDEAGQALTAIRIGLELIETDLPEESQDLKDVVRQTSDLTTRTMNNLRQMAHALRPLEIDTIGLEAAVEDLCHETTRLSGVKVQHSISISPEVPDSVVICVYRIIQEALNNVTKHACAKRVWISTETGPSLLQLTIRDDGKGFDIPSTLALAGQHPGLGLLGMRERIELMGGVFTITSKPGKGTKIQARIPWKEEL
jgi:PAS domain S-box-containing protein